MVLAVRRALTSFVLLLALFVAFLPDAPGQTRKELRVGVAGIPAGARSRRLDRRCRSFDRSAGVRHACCLSRRHHRRRSRARHSLGGVARWTYWTFTVARRRAVPRRQRGDRFRGGGELPADPRPRGRRLADACCAAAPASSRKSVLPMRIPCSSYWSNHTRRCLRSSPTRGSASRGPCTGTDGTTRFVGSGPYRVVDAAPGRVALEAVAGHWGSPPRAERIVFLEVATDENAEAEFDARGARHLVSRRRRLAG